MSAVAAPALRPGLGRATASLLAAVTIWSATFVVTKEALAGVGPMTLMLLRFATGAACLAPFARRHGFRLRMSLQPRYVAFGLTGMVLHIGLETTGLLFTSAATASLIVAAIPAVTAALSVVVLHERPSRVNVAGIALSVAGVVAVTNARVEDAGRLQGLGNLLVLGGVVAWAAFTMQGKRLSARVPALVTTTAAMGAAVVVLVPLAGAEIALGGPLEVGPTTAASIAYLGVLASAVAYGLWNHALEHVDASAAATYVNLVPVLGVASALLAGEPASAPQIAGGAIVGAGVWLSTRR